MIDQLLDEPYFDKGFIPEINWNTELVGLFRFEHIMNALYDKSYPLRAFRYNGKVIDNSKDLMWVLEERILEVESDIMVFIDGYHRSVFKQSFQFAGLTKNEQFINLSLEVYLEDRNLNDLLFYKSCLKELLIMECTFD